MLKVAELEGALLDYWVAKAEGLSPYIETAQRSTTQVCFLPADPAKGKWYPTRFAPSTDWSQGGLIIERERLCVETFKGCRDDWRAFDLSGGHLGAGRTPLTAAMRAYVASKFGDEVPDA